jgi:alkanesulfonate monooxygenase SsuD/methylene tetrahydromethanopterin reductase-like flavin-dependent oxidoreductase (luciferase family)
MKFILLHIPQIPGDKSARRPAGRNVDAYQEMLAQCESHVRLADKLGFYAYATAEHHFHTEGFEVMSAPLIYYSKLAALTENIKFIPMSLVPVATNPLRVAEEAAMFDNLYPGRMEIGLARGYQSRWMQTMAQDENVTSGMPGTESDARNREIFEEYVEVMKLAWSEDAFSYSGKHIQIPYPATGLQYPAAAVARELGSEGEIAEDGTVAKLGVVPKPITQPHPQLWVPFTLSPKSLVNAAQGGYNMLMQVSNPEIMLSFLTQYRDEANKAGRNRALGEGIAVLRDLVIGESEDHAFDLAVRGSASLAYNYFQHFGFMEAWRIPSDDPDRMPLMFDSPEELAQRMIDLKFILAGTLDTVIDKLEETRTAFGQGANIESVIWQMGVQGTTTEEEAMTQLRIVGEEILPRFADR